MNQQCIQKVFFKKSLVYSEQTPSSTTYFRPVDRRRSVDSIQRVPDLGIYLDADLETQMQAHRTASRCAAVLRQIYMPDSSLLSGSRVSEFGAGHSGSKPAGLRKCHAGIGT
jgi:hypothetical protein